VSTSVQAMSEGAGIDRAHRRVIIGATVGTVFEWYDFFVYGALATVLSKQFFQGVNATTSLIFALMAFGAGTAIRPLGALVFGRLGDMTGRKYTFLITITVMGLCTAALGVLPTYSQVGVLAPILLVSLRLLQGLALGGEYGGAAIYVAEHAPPGRRGYYTSWIQLSGSIGLIISLLVVLATRFVLRDQFETWGWRIPFLLSLILLAISVYIRLQLEESPVFRDIQRTGRISTRPLSDSFGRWANIGLMLRILFGMMAGEAVVSYVIMVYVLFFLTQTLKLDPLNANLLLAAGLAMAVVMYIGCGRLVDRIGRKPVFVAGCLLSALTFFPIFKALTFYVNPAVAAAVATSPVTIVADPKECSFQFDPVGKARFSSSCDIAKTALTTANVSYSNEAATPGSVAQVRIGQRRITSFDGNAMDAGALKQQGAAFRSEVMQALSAAGYPARADPARVNYPMAFLLLCALQALGVMAYGPLAAWLVELFPPRIRYTSMSLPYNIGVGWFGGFLPSIAFAINAYTGNIYSGLWYPVIVAAISAVICIVALPETRGLAAE
jgi:MFS family permease